MKAGWRFCYYLGLELLLFILLSSFYFLLQFWNLKDVLNFRIGIMQLLCHGSLLHKLLENGVVKIDDM
jgi:hypothetical protein